jgi:DTW domain-containing protein YfiP
MRCYRCFRSTEFCLCPLIQSFESNIDFVILMHPMEAKKERCGTGRMSHLFLKHSFLLIGIQFNDDPTLKMILNDQTRDVRLLYPGEESILLSSLRAEDFQFSVDQPKKRLTLLLIDGTWPCARKMMKLSTCLHTLPRISLHPEKPSDFLAIKQQPHPLCLSTLETITAILCWNNQKRQADQMISVFHTMIRQQQEAASDPQRHRYRQGNHNQLGYKLPEKRLLSTKWQKRSLFFLPKNNS